mgnify:CR=1 FL=1
MIFDVWDIIFGFLEDKKSVLQLKNTSKNCYIGFMNHMKYSETAYARSTFIPINTCMCCDNVFYKTNTIVYTEYHPPRMIVYCESQECFFRALKTFLKDMMRENKYPFFEKQNNIVKVPRSNKEYSVGKITKYPLVLHNSVLCVECEFEDFSSCEATIETLLDNENYKPKLCLKKLVDSSLYNVNVLNLFKMKFHL